MTNWELEPERETEKRTSNTHPKKKVTLFAWLPARGTKVVVCAREPAQRKAERKRRTRDEKNPKTRHDYTNPQKHEAWCGALYVLCEGAVLISSFFGRFLVQVGFGLLVLGGREDSALLFSSNCIWKGPRKPKNWIGGKVPSGAGEVPSMLVWVHSIDGLMIGVH
jgi:hypothetical protein